MELFVSLDLEPVLSHRLGVVDLQEVILLVFLKGRVWDEGELLPCRDLLLVPPVRWAPDMEEEVIPHQDVFGLQRALDLFGGSDHIPAKLAQVVHGVVPFPETMQVVFHLLQHLLCVPGAAQSVKALDVQPTHETELRQTVQDLLLPFHSLDGCRRHFPAPFSA